MCFVCRGGLGSGGLLGVPVFLFSQVSPVGALPLELALVLQTRPVTECRVRSIRKHHLRPQLDLNLVLHTVIDERDVVAFEVASVEYDRSYFYSPKAFVNAFQVHGKLFRGIEFRKSVKSGQILAFCDCQRV